MQSFRYVTPRTPQEIVSVLEAEGPGARLLAGGTDLLSQLRAGAFRPSVLVDVKRAEGLASLSAEEGGLAIGAAVILNRLLEEGPRLLSAGHGALLEAVAALASYPIRNRATLVGNVANASPCADSVPPLCALGAEVEILGAAGARRVAVERFITGNRETQLGRGEIVTGVHVPRVTRGTWSGFLKRKRVRGHDLALASVALLRDTERGRLRLAVGSCSPAPVVVNLDAEAERPDPERAARLAMESIHPIDDVRASIEYRRDMVGVMVRRLFARMASERAAS
jgi:CO/xanthine dehydrogenase FAD-binding subunit